MKSALVVLLTACLFVAIADACDPNPCDGGGYCRRQKTGGYECTCTNDRIGRRCQFTRATPINPCTDQTDPRRCVGEICHSTPKMIGYVCKPRQTPPVVVALTDPCNPNPCNGYGYCQVDSGSEGGYSCICKNNRMGDHCETKMTVPRNPCGTGIDCSGQVCRSPPDMIGHMCVPRPIAITDPCNPNPCEESGYCQVNAKRNTFKCTCINSRRGRTCQFNEVPPRNPCEEDSTLCPGQTCSSPSHIIGYDCN